MTLRRTTRRTSSIGKSLSSRAKRGISGGKWTGFSTPRSLASLGMTVSQQSHVGSAAGIQLLDKHALQHLARGRARQLFDDVNLAGNFPLGQVLIAREIAQFFGLQLPAAI